MTRASAIFLFTAGVISAATLTDHQIAETAKRIETLSRKESARPRADTRRRAAELLANVNPRLAAQFGSGARSAVPPEAPVHTPDPRVRAMQAQLPEAERRRFIEDALAFIRTLDIAQQRAPLIELLDGFDDLKLESKAIEPAAAQFLHAVEHSPEDPDDYERLSSLRRRYDLTVGGDNASVRARDALAELAALVSTAYDFSLASLEGRSITLKQQRGRWVMLSFWATWCAPCIRELPAIEKLHRERRDLIVFAITDESGEQVREFMKLNGYTFPVLLDPGRTVFEHYRVRTMPEARVIDKTGRQRAELNVAGEQEIVDLLETMR